MPQHVTRVVATQCEPDEHGVERWRVDWTWTSRGRAEQLTQTHDSRAAARRHVSGLLRDTASGLARDDVLEVRLREQDTPHDTSNACRQPKPRA